MLRLIGILTGSSIAIALLLIALGVPEFSASEKGVEPVYAETIPDAAIIKEEPEKVIRPLLAELDEESEKVVRPLSAETEELIEEIFSPQPTVHEAVVDDNWYAFWSPFRSEIAADGFVSKLQETTGIDYRVVKVKTGVYEVAFAYQDEADIEEKLARISSATGLDMTGG